MPDSLNNVLEISGDTHKVGSRLVIKVSFLVKTDTKIKRRWIIEIGQPGMIWILGLLSHPQHPRTLE